MADFDDARLEDRDALAAADGVLRRLAGAGARLRVEAERAAEPLGGFAVDRPRAIIAAGAEARLVRALLEPTCPVPFVAWPSAGLPGWVGPLDLVVVMAPEGDHPDLVATVVEAVRRGCTLLLACPVPSQLAEQAGGRSTTLIPTATGDPLASATMVLAALASALLGPDVDPDGVADAMDLVAEECSPFVDLASNPAKDIALALADAQPLVWGGSVLAARASRRVAESIRAASGRTALAADAPALATVLQGADVRDVFDDPFDNPVTDRRPALVILDDGRDAQPVVAARRWLERLADDRDVRVAPVVRDVGSDLARYAALLQTGCYAAAYLGVGLGRDEAGRTP
ncbi:SIS domain-containing protein [Mariniluteicoccus flavus]